MRRKKRGFDREKREQEFRDFLNAKIQRIRDNGNPRAADAMERFWADLSHRPWYTGEPFQAASESSE